MATLESALPASSRDSLRHSLQLIGFSLALSYAVFLTCSAFERAWLIDSLGRVIDNDFIGVWAAGRLALDGHPAAAWDWSLHRAVEFAVAGHDFATPFQVRSATVQHRRHGGVNGRGKGQGQGL